jgi:hypothetical protein
MKNRFIAHIVFCLFLLLMAGCGAGNSGTQQSSSTLDASQGCINCHSLQGTDWKLSTHNTKDGAACVDCHAVHVGHPNSCNTCHNGQTSSDPTSVPLRNRCMTCHLGNVSGDSIKNEAGDFSAMTFINSASLPGGWTIYRKIGFSFYTSTAKYANPANYLHYMIGVGNTRGTGTSDTCITCHIGQASEPKRHLPLPVDRSGNLLSTVCGNCHGSGETNMPPVMSTQNLKNEKGDYEAALAVLAKVLKDRGFSYTEVYPNFTNTDWATDSGTTGGFGNAVVPGSGGMTAGKYTMGAAFNFNLLWHDYGAYAHNRYYAKRLIYDSIDWVVNKGTMKGTIESVLPASAPSPGQLLFIKADGLTRVYYNDQVKSKAIVYLQGTDINPSGVGGIRP